MSLEGTPGPFASSGAPVGASVQQETKLLKTKLGLLITNSTMIDQIMVNYTNNVDDLLRIVDTIMKSYLGSKKAGDKFIKRLIDAGMRSGKLNIGSLAKKEFPLAITYKQIGTKQSWRLHVPTNPEQYADDELVIQAYNFALQQDLPIMEEPGVYKCKKESPESDSFLLGYFYEMLDESPISHINYTRENAWANGRACARFELLKAVLPATEHSYIRNVHNEIMGESISRESRQLLKRYVDSCYEKDQREGVLSFFKQIAKFVSTRDNLGIDKFSEGVKSFLVNFNDLQCLCRRKKTEVQKTRRKGKLVTTPVVLSLTPSRPDSLAGICPFEIGAITELYCVPWMNQVKLRESFDERDPLKTKISDYRDELSKIVNNMWIEKQKALRSTKPRTEYAKKILQKGPMNRQELLRNTKDFYRSVNNFEEYKLLLETERTIYIFPFGQWKDKETTYGSFETFLEENPKLYPECQKILLTFKELTPKKVEEVIPKPSLIEQNPFYQSETDNEDNEEEEVPVEIPKPIPYQKVSKVKKWQKKPQPVSFGDFIQASGKPQIPTHSKGNSNVEVIKQIKPAFK